MDNLSDFENKYGNIFFSAWYQKVQREKLDEEYENEYYNVLRFFGSPNRGYEMFKLEFMNDEIITKIKLFYK